MSKAIRDIFPSLHLSRRRLSRRILPIQLAPPAFRRRRKRRNPAPAIDEPAALRDRRRRCWRGDASGACRACSSMSRASRTPSPAMPAAKRRRRSIIPSAAATTGHAESVNITFDPRKISYGRILQIYFSVAHDPTELNRQGPDTGTQYRSAIFPANAEQARVAEAYIAQLNKARAFDAAIVTKSSPTRLLSGRGLSSGFSRPAPEPPLYRLSTICRRSAS